MKNLRVKTEFIGACTSVKGIGQIQIREDHVNILAQAGRFELLDGDAPNHKKLVPVASKEEDCIPCLKTHELRERAKDLPEYKPSLTRGKLIELLENASANKG